MSYLSILIFEIFSYVVNLFHCRIVYKQLITKINSDERKYNSELKRITTNILVRLLFVTKMHELIRTYISSFNVLLLLSSFSFTYNSICTYTWIISNQEDKSLKMNIWSDLNTINDLACLIIQFQFKT